MNDIDRVREALGPDGDRWIKGALHDMTRTRHCLIGAIEQAVYNHQYNTRPDPNTDAYGHWLTARDVRVHRIITLLDTIVVEQYPDRQNYDLDPVPAFNDHEDTTWRDIEVVLDKAEVALAERYPGA